MTWIMLVALHCIALHCIALHCIALHCIALHPYGFFLGSQLHFPGVTIPAFLLLEILNA
jgi:hypothetical protein